MAPSASKLAMAAPHTCRRQPSETEVHGATVAFVRAAHGRIVTVDGIKGKHTVLACKRKALAKLGAGAYGSDSYLRLGTQVMRDDETIGAYISDGESFIDVQLLRRQRGGCFMVTLSILTILALSALLSLCTCGTSLIVWPFLLPLVFILPFCCL